MKKVDEGDRREGKSKGDGKGEEGRESMGKRRKQGKEGRKRKR